MRKSNSIVRTITIKGDIKDAERMHYNIEFMTFSEYIEKSVHSYAHIVFKIHPYKWYDIRWIFQIPSYWLLLKIFRIDRAKISTAKHNAMSTTVLIIEMLSIIKLIFEIKNLL